MIRSEPADMSRFWVGLIGLLLVCASVGGAVAQPRVLCPAVGRIVLPDGERGAMCDYWTEQSDIGFGRAHIFATDAHGTVLARSYVSSAWWLLCKAGRCDAVDSKRGVILELDPPTFRASSHAGPERSQLWTLWEKRDEMWGFRARPATWWDYLRFDGTLALAWLACGLLLGVTIALRRNYVLKNYVLTPIVACAALFCFGWTIFTLLPFALGGALLAVGAIPIWLASRQRSMRRMAPSH
jgi:hypothetical protein